ncbi:hypothetical protein BV20DRAFT_1054233 [Pilatotrama ljubarskyi]|nr:hypothetical protein BV20DRAFT_1054233 [Pilatotrama ljubarskyi]
MSVSTLGPPSPLPAGATAAHRRPSRRPPALIIPFLSVTAPALPRQPHASAIPIPPLAHSPRFPPPVLSVYYPHAGAHHPAPRRRSPALPAACPRPPRRLSPPSPPPVPAPPPSLHQPHHAK